MNSSLSKSGERNAALKVAASAVSIPKAQCDQLHAHVRRCGGPFPAAEPQTVGPKGISREFVGKQAFLAIVHPKSSKIDPRQQPWRSRRSACNLHLVSASQNDKNDSAMNASFIAAVAIISVACRQ